MDETRARHVQIHGRSLRVFEAGDGDPVILLHGGGADSSILSWGDVFDPLSRHVHLYALDWPGYGRSEPIEGVLTGERLVDTLVALIDHLGIARVNLAGISMGGEAALGYALRTTRSRGRSSISRSSRNRCCAGIGVCSRPGRDSSNVRCAHCYRAGIRFRASCPCR